MPGPEALFSLASTAVLPGWLLLGFSSLADVQKLFADPWLLLAGWIHYLVFDLFIGAWEVRDARGSDDGEARRARGLRRKAWTRARSARSVPGSREMRSPTFIHALEFQ